MKPLQIVNKLLEGNNWARELIGEASVHRPRRGEILVASFTGVDGQQWKSTGTTDRALALVRANEFAAGARVQRANSGRPANPSKPGLHQVAGTAGGGLTQREVGLLLGLSERAVRAIEKRALRKLAQHPRLQEIWRRFRAGELTEQEHRLSALEIQALWGLTRSQAERAALRKALAEVPALPNRTGPERTRTPDP